MDILNPLQSGTNVFDPTPDEPEAQQSQFDDWLEKETEPGDDSLTAISPAPVICDFIMAGHSQPITIVNMNPDLLKSRKARFRQLCTNFLTAMLAWIQSSIVIADQIKWDHIPTTKFIGYFVEKTAKDFVVDFMCGTFLERAQIDASKTSWGDYVDVLWHPIYGYLTYIGSATGPEGLFGRVKTYSQAPTSSAIKHHALMWEPDWEPSFHQLQDSTLGNMDSRHRVFTVFSETFGIVLTDSFDKDAPSSKWNPFGSADFVRQFQVDNHIIIRDVQFHYRLNRCLPTKQPMRIDRRFEDIVCINCDCDQPPFYSSDPGKLFDLANRLCRKCYDFKHEHLSSRPINYIDRYALWKTESGDDCWICGTSFSRLLTAWGQPRKQLLIELVLWVCQDCTYQWKRNGLLLPIKGLHIPADHLFACDHCGTKSSRWFEFCILDVHKGKCYCYQCCLRLRPFPVDKFRDTYSASVARLARYPTVEDFKTLKQNTKYRNLRLGLVLYALRNFAIDMTTAEKVMAQRKIDLESANVEVPQSLLDAIAVGKPVEPQKDAGIRKKRKTNEAEN